MGCYSISVPTFICAHRLTWTRRAWRGESPGVMLVWDVQTGVLIGNSHVGNLGNVAFIGNQGKIALIDKDTFCIYDGLIGTRVCDGTIPESPSLQLGAEWAHGESLRFATSSKTGEGLMIRICELQPTSVPPLLVVDSFQIPFYPGEFTFSPVAFHASFVTREEVIIVNLRDPNSSFRTGAARPLYRPRGCFSPDGSFFACGTDEQEILVWKNAPTGYVPWNTLRLRLPFSGFSFSASGTSILSWGPEGVQLLDQDNRLSPPSSDKVEPDHYRRKHLVAYSTDSACIATARQEGSVVTILDSLSGTPQQFIDMDTQILDIGIVDDAVYAMDARALASCQLEAGGTVRDAHDVRRVTIDLAAHAHGGSVERVVLSRDCSQIAFTTEETVFLYDVEAQEIFDKRTMDDKIMDIQFSPDGRHLCITTIVGIYDEHERPSIHCFVKLEMGEDRRFGNVTREFLEVEWSRNSLLQPPHGYRIGTGSDWVEDSKGSKVLWLPPGWRTKHGLGARWNGRFLALVGGHNLRPIIVEFQP